MYISHHNVYNVMCLCKKMLIPRSFISHLMMHI